MTTLPEVGTRWYIAGQHWQVIRHETRDGEPAVRFKSVKGRVEFVWIWRLVEKRALRSEVTA